MNQKQRDYAIKRIKDLAASHTAKLTADHTKPAKRLTWRQALSLYLLGELSLNPDLKESTRDYKYPKQVFNLEELEFEQHVSDEGLALINEVSANVQKAEDALMLGDADQALKAIADFEASLK